MNYYNEHDPKAAAWLRELIRAGIIPAGDVDERDIQKVNASDVCGYVQRHWFAGIGGWAYALKLARYPDDKPIDTISCPCQPFSNAGKKKAHKDERHLWPVAFELFKELRPKIIVGEQVASAEVVGTQLEATFVDAVQKGDFAKANRIANLLIKSNSLHYTERWLDGIQANLESIDYTIGAAVLGAHSLRAPHIRQRLYWVADSERATGKSGRIAIQSRESPGAEKAGSYAESGRCGMFSGLANGEQQRLEGHSGHVNDRSEPGRLGADAVGPIAEGGCTGFWDSYDLIPCRDGKTRRIERRPESVADGVSDLVDALRAAGVDEDQIAKAFETWPLVSDQKGRVMMLRGYGNAIVPQVAAAFIQATEETINSL